MSSTPETDTSVKALSTHQVVIRIAIIVAVVESLIMLVLESIPHEADAYTEAIADTGLLIIFSIPAIFLWVIKPFVTARDHALARISHLAHIDPLTQLTNRRMLSTHLEKAIASTIRHGLYGALLLLDLDRFKPVNDAHGHKVGDALLVEIAARMQSVTRSEDVVARLGGDEFVVLIGYLDVDEKRARHKASRIAENLIELVSKPFDYHGTRLQVGASIGIRLLGTEKLDPDTAISQADRALYQAKHTGRGRVVFFAQ